MSKSPSNTMPDAAAAIDEILVAETAARRAMEACRGEAEDILEAAREDARRINRRTTQRITRLHNRCSELVATAIANIHTEAGAEAFRGALDDHDREVLARAVNRLATRLTWPGHG
jgi:vacuolar-type H+-ATPase subunit H